MMYFPTVEYAASDYIKTSTGNIVSRKALIVKPQAVELPGGRCIVGDNVVIRGDLAPVQVNKYSNIGAGTVLRPGTIMTAAPAAAGEGAPASASASASASGGLRFIPMTVGSHTQIGRDCIIEAAVIGMGCVIGDSCIICPRAVLKDFVTVQDGAVVCPDTVVPPFSIVAGRPGRIVGEAPESTSTLAVADAVKVFKSWRPV